MKRKYGFVAFLLAGILLAGMGLTGLYVRENEGTKGQELTVVTSFYPMYILAMNVIGDTPGITLANLSENQTGCLHDYQLTPEDMKLLSSADVFIVNGGGIESFLAEVAENYPELLIVNASEDVELLGEVHSEAEHDADGHSEAEHADAHELDEHGDAEHTDVHETDEHSHGEENAHAWMNISDYMIQVQTVAQQLAQADSAHAEIYEEHTRNYLDQLTVLLEEAEEVKQLAAGSEIITFHEAYDYAAKEYGLDIIYTMDLDEERQVSAGEMADVAAAVQTHGIKVILAEELYGKRLGDTIERETDATVYYLNTLVRGESEADSYIKGMGENIHLLKEAFAR